MSVGEKSGYWICIAILAGFAAMNSLAVALNVIEGTVEQFSKYGNGRIYHLSEDPGGFLVAIAGHLLFSGMFWWLAFCVWNWRLRGK